jgi:cyclic pyranopterin phosphate synthase
LKPLNIPELCLTTNGQFLEEKLPTLLDAGVNRINISLDTLDPVRFKQICRGGDLATVLKGIDKAVENGIKLKINMVPLKQHNADQVVPMLEYCLERGIELRYIELMKMGHLAQGDEFRQQFWSMKSLLDQISEHYDFAPTRAPVDSSAVRFQIPDRGDFGIIANESKPFCRTCSRLRLSSAGFIYGCLSSTRRHYIVDLLPLERTEGLQAIHLVLGTAMKDKQDLSFTGETTVMKMIGG